MIELSCLIIDDNELDHFVVKMIIANINKEIKVKSFLDPVLAFEYIKSDITNDKLTLMLLDIYMPVMNGFQFIEAFEQLDTQIQEKYYIVAVTSSRERSYINRIKSYKTFKRVLNKPFTALNLSALLTSISTELDIQF
jgi:CheY-like chemotaxis protein